MSSKTFIARASVLASSLVVVAGAWILASCTTQPVTRPQPVTPVTPLLPPNPSVTPPATPAQTLHASTFLAVPGWDRDDLREAWQPFLSSCIVLAKKPDWQERCGSTNQDAWISASTGQQWWFIPKRSGTDM